MPGAPASLLPPPRDIPLLPSMREINQAAEVTGRSSVLVPAEASRIQPATTVDARMVPSVVLADSHCQPVPVAWHRSFLHILIYVLELRAAVVPITLGGFSHLKIDRDFYHAKQIFCLCLPIVGAAEESPSKTVGFLLSHAGAAAWGYGGCRHTRRDAWWRGLDPPLPAWPHHCP